MVETVQNALWVFTIVGQIVITMAMVVRSTYSEYRAFFAYIAFQAVKSVSLLAIGRRNAWAYFWTYWIAELVSLILALAVLQEIFAALVAHESRMKRIGAFMFWSTAVAVLSVVALTLQFSPGQRESALMTGVLTGERAMRVVQAGLLLYIFGFSWLSKVRWRSAEQAIALGMGIFIAAELLIVTARQIYGPVFRVGFFVLKPLAYSMALAIWGRALLFAEKGSAIEHQPAPLVTLNHKLSDILQ